jgi:hypothetical protein
VDDKPETIHLYVVREAEPKPPVFPIILSALSLIVLLVFCVLTPYQQPVIRSIIRVPAVLLPPKTFTALIAIVPTGVRTYPATVAHGTLTITNGSIIGQSMPAGFTVQGVATDSAVYVPGGNANGYGWAQVSTHAVIGGHGGNLPPYVINSVIGSSVYIRNLSAFSGGRDGYLVKVITAQDRGVAIEKARYSLLSMSMGLHYPCVEAVRVSKAVIGMSWHCQMLTYHIAAFYHVTGFRIVGKNLLLSIWFIPRPIRYWVK